MIMITSRLVLIGLLFLIPLAPLADAANDPVPGIVIEAANINLGFDLPIHNDRHQNSAPDQENAEWWTIVARTDGTVTIPGGNEKYIKKENTNIHVKFLDGINPAEYKVRPRTGAADYIGVVNNNGGGDVMESDTTLKITGKNTANQDTPIVAEVEIYKPGKPSKILKVHLMRVRKIVLGVYFVKATTSTQTEPHSAFRTSATIIQRLNEIYRQACIEFELSSDSSDNLITYNYDIRPIPTTPPNLKLDIGWTPVGYGAEGDRILGIGPDSFPVLRKLSLIIVQDLAVTPRGAQQPNNDVGITPANHNTPVTRPNRCVVETKHFEGSLPGGGNDLEEFYLTCAHEIGHALGVCTRDVGASIMHDPGDFPSNQYNLDGTPANNGQAPRMNGSLMKQGFGGWRWIRHEDWKWANEQAPQFTP